MKRNNYNLRSSEERKPSKYFDKSIFLNFENKNNLQNFEIKSPYNTNNNVISFIKVKDKKLPPLRKNYSRPYFSPYFNSWEMDFMIICFDIKNADFIYSSYLYLTDNKRFD
jgi:hypothetical protein